MNSLHTAQLAGIDAMMDTFFSAPKQPCFKFYHADVRCDGVVDEREDHRLKIEVRGAVEIGSGDKIEDGDEYFTVPAYRDLLAADAEDNVYWYNSTECRWDECRADRWQEVTP